MGWHITQKLDAMCPYLFCIGLCLLKQIFEMITSLFTHIAAAQNDDKADQSLSVRA